MRQLTDLRNPVIEGYLSGLEARRQAEQDEIKNQLQQAENERQEQEMALKEKQFQQYIKNLDAETKHRESILEIEKTKLHEQQQKNKVDAQRQIYQDIHSGVRRAPTAGEANSSPVGGIQIGDMVVDPRQAVTPEQTFQRKLSEEKQMTPVLADRTRQVTDASEGVKAGYSQVSAEQKRMADLEMQRLRGTQESQQIEQQGGIQRGLVRLRNQGDMDVARLRQFTEFQNGEDVVKAIKPFITGKAASSLGKNPRDRVMLQHINAAGFREFTAKDSKELSSLHALDPLEAKMEEIMKTLPKDKIGALGQKVEAKLSITDVANITGIIKSTAGQISKSIGGESGRLTEDDINRAIGMLVVPGITRSQAAERLKYFTANRRSKILDQVLGNMSEKQRVMVLAEHGYDPLKFAITINGKDVPRYIKDADGDYRIADPKKGGYVKLDAAN